MQRLACRKHCVVCVQFLLLRCAQGRLVHAYTLTKQSTCLLRVEAKHLVPGRVGALVDGPRFAYEVVVNEDLDKTAHFIKEAGLGQLQAAYDA